MEFEEWKLTSLSSTVIKETNPKTALLKLKEKDEEND